MRMTARLAAAITAWLTAAFLVAACHTTEGVGRDMESAGDAIGDAARDAK